RRDVRDAYGRVAVRGPADERVRPVADRESLARSRPRAGADAPRGPRRRAGSRIRHLPVPRPEPAASVCDHGRADLRAEPASRRTRTGTAGAAAQGPGLVGAGGVKESEGTGTKEGRGRTTGSERRG